MKKRKKKDDHYSLDSLDKIVAFYKALLGERSNGKSYAVKKKLMEDAWITDIIFIFLRRYGEDIKSAIIIQYWEDMIYNDNGFSEIDALTEGQCNCFDYYKNALYFAHRDDTGKVTRIKKMAFVMCLAADEHYRSMAFPRVKYMMFEEFIPPLDNPFIPREYDRFMNIVSTVFRKREGVVYLIANTNKPFCPIFDEWGIMPEMLEQGKISIVNHEITDKEGNSENVKIAVEYCGNVGSDTKMILGRRRDVITKGTWDTRSYPHLPDRYKSYKRWYKMYYINNERSFVIRLLSDYNMPFLYVYPCKKDEIPEHSRVVEDAFNLDSMYTRTFDHFVTKYDKLVYELLVRKDVVYSTNLCGTMFNELLKYKEGRKV